MRQLKPIKFPESNGVLVRPRGSVAPCGELPCYRGQGTVISCWKIPFLQRVIALFTGRIWVGLKGDIQAPIWVVIDRPFYKDNK